MPVADAHLILAREYFDDMARRFPVMCASDEFHFLPRAQAAANYYDKLDDLDSRTIEASIDKFKGLQNNFSRLEKSEEDLETLIDLRVLQASIAGYLIEFDHKRLWQFNPLIYLKIVFIGLDHALGKPAADDRERIHRVLARLADAPRVLEQALANITAVPQTYHQASRSMVADCRNYLKDVAHILADAVTGRSATMLPIYMDKIAAALDALDRFLSSLIPQPDQDFAVKTLPQTLKNHFLSVRSVDEIYQMAVEDWHTNLEQLEKLKSKIDPSSSWQDLYHGYFPSDIVRTDTMGLYQEEIDRLRTFFSGQGFDTEALGTPVEIAETPGYLRSVRGAASFAAAFSADTRETSYFYITTHLAGKNTSAADNLLKKRFHREFKPLTAHETVPGHHYLDAVRRNLSNPVRRQIESPLFYEGWASYAEYMLIDSGYINSPLDLLVDYKRRLWRSARCQVDVGLTTEKIKLDDAVHLLKVCGFSAGEASRQVYRFRLNPGYQLCYSLGCHEFKQLKEFYGNRMDTARVHRTMLDGGEIPFQLIEQRLKELLSADSKSGSGKSEVEHLT
ncbi:MAG: DUF885 family protein [Deltaproteobacteria bacterium]|nr:DUF885 family protein [Deltaproteobacteria bacterium]